MDSIENKRMLDEEEEDSEVSDLTSRQKDEEEQELESSTETVVIMSKTFTESIKPDQEFVPINLDCIDSDVSLPAQTEIENIAKENASEEIVLACLFPIRDDVKTDNNNQQGITNNVALPVRPEFENNTNNEKPAELLPVQSTDKIEGRINQEKGTLASSSLPVPETVASGESEEKENILISAVHQAQDLTAEFKKLQDILENMFSFGECRDIEATENEIEMMKENETELATIESESVENRSNDELDMRKNKDEHLPVDVDTLLACAPHENKVGVVCGAGGEINENKSKIRENNNKDTNVGIDDSRQEKSL